MELGITEKRAMIGMLRRLADNLEASLEQNAVADQVLEVAAAEEVPEQVPMREVEGVVPPNPQATGIDISKYYLNYDLLVKRCNYGCKNRFFEGEDRMEKYIDHLVSCHKRSIPECTI